MQAWKFCWKFSLEIRTTFFKITVNFLKWNQPNLIPWGHRRQLEQLYKKFSAQKRKTSAEYVRKNDLCSFSKINLLNCCSRHVKALLETLPKLFAQIQKICRKAFFSKKNFGPDDFCTYVDWTCNKPTKNFPLRVGKFSLTTDKSLNYWI